ncbi:MAG TPA: NAD(P)H-hydrate dehydratase [Thermoanaerobaculia bacterium]|nr:NAD(P)H-hydrate dehydratase [Thermoanaerobaculia bacterium]
MRILSAEAMRAVDRHAIEELGVPGMVLMENAALGVVEAIGEVYGEARSAAVFCGPGNNGGDGLAVARLLTVRGYDVRIFLVRPADKPAGLTGDAGTQLAIVRKLDLPLQEVGPGDDLAPVLAAARDSDVIVDALFGTGLGRPLEGVFAALVEGLNGLPVPRVAVDLPSGLNGSRSDVFGPHVRAHLTVTFAAPKVAHVFPPASEAVGELVVTDLGVPQDLVDDAAEPGGALHLLVGEELAALVPPREPGTHKGDYGHALIVAGSPGKSGAAILAARAAIRAGAGLVTAAVPAPILDVVDLGSIESMSLALPAGPVADGGQLTEEAAARVLAAAEGKDALAVGPGLGTDAAPAIRRIAAECPLPLVLDADGLNAFAGRAAELAGRPGPTVLTPHPGELGRLLGISTAEVQADRIAAARRAAAETGAVTVLKGSLTLIAEPDGTVWVNPTGNPGMASGGTGDVLTGMIAGLLAQGLGPLDAARLGVYLHGLAGDLAAARLGEPSLAAGDLLDSLPAAFRRLAGES